MIWDYVTHNGWYAIKSSQSKSGQMMANKATRNKKKIEGRVFNNGSGDQGSILGPTKNFFFLNGT